MTLHPLTIKGGAFVLNLGSVFKDPGRFASGIFIYCLFTRPRIWGPGKRSVAGNREEAGCPPRPGRLTVHRDSNPALAVRRQFPSEASVKPRPIRRTAGQRHKHPGRTSARGVCFSRTFFHPFRRDMGAEAPGSRGTNTAEPFSGYTFSLR